MPRILGIGTAVPPHSVQQEEACEFARLLFSTSDFGAERLLPVFKNTTIQKRHFCVPVEWFNEDHGFAEKNLTYLQSGVELAAGAIEDACSRCDISPSEIGHIFFVSSTGISTPSLDAYLFNRLRFQPAILRTPIWGLGCAGGVAGIIRATDWLKAYPAKIALVVALELCGLTFLHNDRSKSNFIATSLFSDGCGAVLMAGDRGNKLTDKMISIEASSSVTWTDTLDIMGWKLVEGGLKVLFSKSIPDVVQRSAGPAVRDFLAEVGLEMDDIKYFISHPGGARVIEAYREALELEEYQVQSMRKVLCEYGNMSSATILFVFQDFLNSGAHRQGDRIFSTALGPGFSSEMLVGRCH